MIVEENYIQKAGGDSADNVNLSDIRKAILELSKMDDEHGAFWVGIFGPEIDEVVLEVHKDLTLIGNFDGTAENEIKKVAKNWNEVESNFELLLNGNLTELKKRLKKN
ncbi:hypothetical protein H7F37_04440 [Winogradskyella sp. PAMC22761]|jgi:hypothetical protein|nr:hypothetical protein H7F37_04440 [Winogradskyella sp. PAMC22761]